MEQWIADIRQRAATGKPLVSGGRTRLDIPDFDSLLFIPAQLAIRPKDYFREEILAETVLGKESKSPLRLRTPILIAAMSFGAISKEAKIALARASTAAGTATNTGEGGMLPEEREAAAKLIVQYSTGRFGITEEVLRAADAIEIKLGQSAKPGQGGLLPAAKVTAEIAKIRGVPIGQDIHSPPAHPDIKTIADLGKKVNWLREITGGKPIIIKLAAGALEQDIRAAIAAGPDVLAIDGLGGATGAAPRVMLDNFGIPTMIALIRTRAIMDKLGAKQQLIIGGGLNSGADVAKALALGADGVFMAMPLLIAMGCTYCAQCHLGRCPVGIATQDPALRSKLRTDLAAGQVANFITACTEETKMVAAACGKADIHKLSKEDLLSISPELSQLTGIRLV
jgi:glutamate synthase domain-containing protein 2